MARIWQSGFELNSVTNEVEFTAFGTNMTTQSAVVRSGRYALRCNLAAQTGFVRHIIYAADQAKVGYQRIYIRVDSYPNSTTSILAFVNTAFTAQCSISMNTSGQLILTNSASAAVGSPSAVLDLGRWYRVELKNDATTTPGTMDARLEGASFASGSNATGVAGTWAQVRCAPAASVTCDMYFDDWALNDTTGTAQTSWAGEGSILHLYPNAAGSVGSWTSSNFANVDDIGAPDDATTLISTTTLNQESYFLIDTIGVGLYDIVNVSMVGVRFSNNTASATQAFIVEAKTGAAGTPLTSSAIIPNNTTWRTNAPGATAIPRLYPLVAHTAPDGSAWSVARLRDLQVGVKETVDATTLIQVSTLWLSVDITPVKPLGVVRLTGLSVALSSTGNW